MDIQLYLTCKFTHDITFYGAYSVSVRWLYIALNSALCLYKLVSAFLWRICWKDIMHFDVISCVICISNYDILRRKTAREILLKMLCCDLSDHWNACNKKFDKISCHCHFKYFCLTLRLLLRKPSSKTIVVF